MTCDACKTNDHRYHSGIQLGFICIGCACTWIPEPHRLQVSSHDS